MKNTYRKTTAYITAHKILSAVVGLILIIGGYYSYKDAKAASTGSSYVLDTVKQGTLTSSITGSGQVSAVNNVEITPLASGQVKSLRVKEGDTIKAGQVIATLDQRSVNVSLTQARSSLTSAQANYDKLVNGQTSQSRAVSELSVSDAQTALDNARKNLLLKLQSDYTATDNLIKTNIDPLYQNPDSFSPVFGITIYASGTNSPTNFNVTDGSQRIRLGTERQQIAQILTQWKSSINTSSTENPLSQVTASENYVKQLQSLVEDIYGAINTIYNSNINYQSQLASYKSGAQSVRSSLASTLSSIESDYQSYHSAEQGVVSANAQFNVTVAAPRSEDVASARAQLQSAQASYQAALINYQNTIITAPIDGKIGDLNLILGAQAGNGAAATIVSPQQLAEITLNEVDAAKVQVGQKAMLSFDAIDGLSISGHVAEVGTIGTVTSGVVDYTVKISMDTVDERVKPGMSVNAAIITSEAENALYIPSSAIKTNNGESFIQTFASLPANANSSSTTPFTTKEIPQSIPVQIGISNETNTQIISGLNAGQSIVVRTIQSTATTNTTNTSRSLFGGGGANNGGNRNLGGANTGAARTGTGATTPPAR